MAIWTKYSQTMNTSNQYIKYRVKLTLNSQNITNNTSNVTVEIQVWRTNQGYTTYGSGTCYVTIDGTQYTSSITPDHKFTYNSYTVVFSRTLNITHNADGKKILNISAWINHNRFSSTSQSWSTTLDTIPRTSSVSVSSSNVYFGNSVTINITRHASSFTHTLRYSVAGQSGTIASGVGTSYTWTVPTSLIAGVSNAASATCTIYCDTYSGSTLIGTSSVTLTLTIPPSTISLSSSSVKYGESVSIQIKRVHSKLTHTLRYNWNNNTGTIVSRTSELFYVWTVPLNFMNYIPNSTSTTGTIYIDTYNGTALVGTKSASLTTIVPDNVVPSFSSISHSEANSAVAALSLGPGVYVQNLSKINISIVGATGAYGSTITSYKIVYDGVVYNGRSITTNTVTTTGTRAITATITDSRGRTATKTINVSVLAYSPPTILSFVVRRSNPDGTDNDLGTYLKVVYSGKVYLLNNKNTTTLYIDTKPRDSSTWTTKGSISITSETFSGQKIYSGYSLTESYDVRIRLVDKFYTTVATKQVSTGIVTMSWSQYGVGIGKIWERGTLDIGGDAYIEGHLYANGIRLTYGNDLPSGDGSINYWQSIPQGVYFARPDTVTGQPSSYGLVFVMRYNNDVNVLWFSQAQGAVYRLSCNATTISGWKKLYGEMEGKIDFPVDQFYEGDGKYALNLNNSDIIGLNCLYFRDACDSGGEGINFYRAADVWDTLYARNGELYFHPNRAKLQNIAGYRVWHSGNDGPGSGLEADMVDGKHANDFVTQTSTHQINMGSSIWAKNNGEGIVLGEVFSNNSSQNARFMIHALSNAVTNVYVDGWLFVNEGNNRVVCSTDSYSKPAIASTSKYSSSGSWVTWDYPDFAAPPNIIHSDYDNYGTKARNVTAASCELCMSGTYTGTVRAIAVGGV